MEVYKIANLEYLKPPSPYDGDRMGGPQGQYLYFMQLIHQWFGVGGGFSELKHKRKYVRVDHSLRVSTVTFVREDLEHVSLLSRVRMSSGAIRVAWKKIPPNVTMGLTLKHVHRSIRNRKVVSENEIVQPFVPRGIPKVGSMIGKLEDFTSVHPPRRA